MKRMTVERFQLLQSRSGQRGVALVVSLIILIVATLLGLAGIRGTNLQERMSANMYDRSLAFQRAESALRAAEIAINANGQIAALGGVDCSIALINVCPMLPANAFTADNANWINVDAAHNINSALSAAGASPQYTIQFMGTGPSESNLDTASNADAANYGSSYPPDDVAYYRVTARSSNPQNADDAGRALVVLQTTVRRPI